MFRATFLAVIACAVLSMPARSNADGIRVSFKHVVTPDADLRKFVRELRGSYLVKGKLDHRRIEALFAARVRTFQKGLDPFQPWNKGQDMTSDYLQGAADLMVEQGDFAEGTVPPDYRPDAWKMIVAQVSADRPFGTMKEVPGAVCAPADHKVDRKSAAAFARKHGLDAYSLRYFATEMEVREKPSDKATVIGTVAPDTLMMFEYDSKAQEPWSLYDVSNGMKGYIREDRPMLGLAQHHVCFGKVKGQYRIVALFGYGL